MITGFILASILLLLIGLFLFGQRKPGYNHLRHTISELGEVGSPVARSVAYGLFLPVGLLLFGVAALTNDSVVQGLATCIGIGYVVAAFFPCDVGSPLAGSSRQQIHNLGGAIEYVGGAFFLSQLTSEQMFFGQNPFVIGAGVVIVGAVLLSVPGLPVRGLVQRLVEAVLFGSLLVVV